MARLAAARETYLREMEAAGDDAKKMALAEKKLHWAEEAVAEAFHQHGTLRAFFERLPLVGHGLTLLLDLVEKAGLARGLPLGILVFVLTIVAVAGFQFVHKVVESGTDLGFFYPLQAEQRTHAMNWSLKAVHERNTVYRDEVRILTKAISYYSIRGLDADSIKHSGGDLKPLLEADEGYFITRLPQDPDLFQRTPKTLPVGAKVFSYFRHYDASVAHFFYLNIEIPFTAKPAHRDLAIVKTERNKAEYVLASLGRSRSAEVILIPLADYQAAGLPMQTPLDGSPAVETDVDETIFHDAAPASVRAAEPSNEEPPPPPPDPPGVPFLAIAKDLYQHIEDDPDVPGKLEEVVNTASEVEKLPIGTSFAPYLKTTGDPNSVLTIKGSNNKLYILVKTRDPDGRDVHGMILRSDYLKSSSQPH